MSIKSALRGRMGMVVGIALLLFAAVGTALWIAPAGGSARESKTGGVGSASAAQPPPSAAPLPVARVREDVWYRLHPEARRAVGEMMDADNPSARNPPEIDLGSNGTMTRLPDRYRPVMVSTQYEGERVIDEVLAMPPDDASPDAPTSRPTRPHVSSRPR